MVNYRISPNHLANSRRAQIANFHCLGRWEGWEGFDGFSGCFFRFWGCFGGGNSPKLDVFGGGQVFGGGKSLSFVRFFVDDVFGGDWFVHEFIRRCGVCCSHWFYYFVTTYPLVNYHGKRKWTLWRCISYSKWGLSLAMFLHQRVLQ